MLVLILKVLDRLRMILSNFVLALLNILFILIKVVDNFLNFKNHIDRNGQEPVFDHLRHLNVVNEEIEDQLVGVGRILCLTSLIELLEV